MSERTAEAGQVFRNGASHLCKRAWWVFLIGGIASVAFGILALINPGVALFVLAMFFAAYVLVEGALNIWGALSNRDKDGWWLLLLLGVAGVLAGGYALLNADVGMLVFVYVVSFIAIFIGTTMSYLGFKIRKEIPNEWILYLCGAVSILFGLLILLNPAEGSVSVVYLIAAWALLVGALRIWFAFRVRGLGERIAGPGPAPS